MTKVLNFQRAGAGPVHLEFMVVPPGAHANIKLHAVMPPGADSSLTLAAHNVLEFSASGAPCAKVLGFAIVSQNVSASLRLRMVQDGDVVPMAGGDQAVQGGQGLSGTEIEITPDSRTSKPIDANGVVFGPYAPGSFVTLYVNLH